MFDFGNYSWRGLPSPLEVALKRGRSNSINFKRAGSLIFEMALVSSILMVSLSLAASFFFESKQREDYAALWLKQLAKAHSKGGIAFQCTQPEATHFYPHPPKIYFDPLLKLSEIPEGQLGERCPRPEQAFEPD